MSKAKTVAEKIETQNHLSEDDKKLIIRSLRLMRKRFVIFREDAKYRNFMYLLDDGSAFCFETKDDAIRMMGVHLTSDRTQGMVVVDMLTTKIVYSSTEMGLCR